ncbi:MAG: hypothetical protein GX597_14135 [Anaerolineaceae bacterium]|nr:hypothetical protein [Anaerolineaceae bacterium]
MLIGQDPANAAFLLGLVAEHGRQGGAVLLVSHAPEVARCHASRLLFFEEGRLVQDAPPAEAFAWLARCGRQAYLPAERSAPVSAANVAAALPAARCVGGGSA